MNPQHLRSVRSLALRSATARSFGDDAPSPVASSVAAPIRAPGASPVTRRVRELALAALMMVATASSRAADVGTAFTYQGSLEKPAGTPIDDTCDFRFGLWDDLGDGMQVGDSPQTVSGVGVSGGLFTVLLDFGAGVFSGEARWLEIKVKCPDDGLFVKLSPRQELTPAPYSIRAGEGVGPPNALEIDPVTGHVGIGTQAPVAGLQVEGPGYPNSFLFLNSTGGNNDSGLRLMRGGDVYWHVFNSELTGDSFNLRNAFFGPILVATQDGRVGIGTTTPAAQLDVNGAARTSTLEITGGSPFVPPLAGWGLNSSGQINVPFDTLIAIAAGWYHSLAIRSDGTLVGWGQNDFRQINVPSGTFTAVAGGYSHSLAIRTDGTLVGWGNANYGLNMVPEGTFTAVAAGNDDSFAIRSDSTLVGWGRNDVGQMNVPTGTFTRIAAGGFYGIAIRDDGTLVGWGLNTDGQIDVPSGTFTAVAAGYDHGLAIRTDGTLVGWGNGGLGEINVPSGTFTAVAAGYYHSLAIRSDGTLVGWGYNDEGQINVPAGTFSAVVAGQFHSLAVRINPPTPDPALRLHTDSAFKPGSNTWTIYSDRRLKKNIEPLSGALERLLQLHGVTFQWSDPSSQGGITGTQMGLIADEVSRAFPQWVGRDPKGYQTLTVGGFEALTAEALRELRAEKDRQINEKDCAIDELQDQEAAKDQRINDLEARLAAIEALLARSGNSNNGGAR